MKTRDASEVRAIARKFDQTGGGGVSDGDKGDITVSGSGTVWTVDAVVAANVTGLSEAVDDRVAALLVAGANVTLTYNDGAGTLTIDAAGGGGSPLMGWFV